MAAIVKSESPASDVPLATAWARPACTAALTLLALSACSRFGGGQDEMAWARAALDRNERLQVVASDPHARTFTVRLKSTGDLRVVSVDQLVAGPASAPGGDLSGNSPAQVGAPAAEAATPSSAPASPDAGTAAATGTNAPPRSTSGSSAPPPAGDTAHPAAGEPAPESGEPAAATTAEVRGPHAESATDAKAGSVLASGPGYSIKASGAKGNQAGVATGLTAARGTPVERLHDPIICQGSRLLHIDNRNLEFDGDAVTAEDGCEIHITNSRIRAKGIGVQARAANVHIENSEIDGDSGAIDASEGAQIYAESSRFKGLNRHMQASAFHDLGGNVWN